MLSQKILESIPQAVRTLRSISTENLNRSLSLQQLRVLNLITEGMGQTTMSEVLQVSLAAISKMVESLVKKGLVVRKEGADKRTQVLKLTAKGQKLMGQVTSHVRTTLNEGIKVLSSKEKEELIQGLIILDKLIAELKKV